MTTLLDKATVGDQRRPESRRYCQLIRIAHCCRGSLRAEATGGPAFVVACHCMERQRRTGSPFGVSSCFAKEQVRTEGPSNVYVRGDNSGRKNESISAPTAVPPCSGTRKLSRTLSIILHVQLS